MCDIGKTKAVHKDEPEPIVVKPQPVVIEPIKVREPVMVRRIKREARI